MDTKIAEQFLDELFSSLETLETQSTSILHFLKDRGGATSEQLAPYMEQASKASNVRWRAARLRLMSLLSSAVKSAEEGKAKTSETKQEEPKPSEMKHAQGEGTGKQPGQSTSLQAQAQAKEATAEPEKGAAAKNTEKDDTAHPVERAPQKPGHKDAA